MFIVFAVLLQFWKCENLKEKNQVLKSDPFLNLKRLRLSIRDVVNSRKALLTPNNVSPICIRSTAILKTNCDPSYCCLLFFNSTSKNVVTYK